MLTHHIIIINTLLLFLVDVRCEEEEDHITVPECPYEYKDGAFICPNVTSGGAIPKLMQCANKMKHDFMGFCKSRSFKDKRHTIAQLTAYCIIN